MAHRTRALLDSIFASEAMQEVFCGRGGLQGMLDFESALAHAQARAGLFSAETADVIGAQCRADLFDLSALSRGAALSGNSAIPMIRALTELVAARDPSAARLVHFGATSQDAIDTGLVLQLRRAIDLLESDLARLARALAALAHAHRKTPLLGRTWLQPAPPVTFGLKAAGWLSAVERHRARLREMAPRIFVTQFGGAVGTLASLGVHGLAVADELARELKLAVPDMPWHAHRDRVAEVGTVLALLTGTLGKIGRDLSLLSQAEVGEAFEPSAPGRGGSSTMPHKRNPIAAAAMLAAATRVPALCATLLSAMPQEHERGLGGWQAEWVVLPEICLLTSGALYHAVRAIEGLTVDVARMQHNIEATRGVVMAEPVALALSRRMDRGAAYQLAERACHDALGQGRSLREVLADNALVLEHLSAEELDRLCDPSAYFGLADEWVSRVLAAHGRSR
ncbi:MAG: 3-carboxy-cis,cis-muconate cycloisomerase [Myxococcota bacterium]|nr:3-carboxy-cis,cis-muconate cycloisomerase [Myxococcota bacterium]